MIKPISKFIVALFILGICLSTYSQRRKTKKQLEAIEKSFKNRMPKPMPKRGAIQPYQKVVTKEYKTDDGLFKVHSKENTYLFEIPDSLLGREMLMVTRIAKTASDKGTGFGKQNTRVLRWEKRKKQILLKGVSYKAVANDSLPIHQAVVNYNLEPILFSFPIKAFSKDSTATVIDVTPLFSRGIKAIDISLGSKRALRLGGVNPSSSYIERISSYPRNIEIRNIKTYSSQNDVGAVSLETSNSMILLPKKPMKRRYFDSRVGWFTSSQIDYGLPAQKAKRLTYLNRWRLEVKDEDIEKFKRGELVEPKKPIVYYIDRATPKKWRKYLKQGVEDWQKAFEVAGFKNAIIAKDAPTKEEDPDFSPEDARYSVIRYQASPTANANGPHVSDPRSGEIIESDINWYHNIMSILHDWALIQTGAVNPEVRKNQFKDEVMGELIRFVSSHEVGHTLGLPHNMGSSFAYPVDSLRSATFTKKYGTAPSIMDYARFNYVAQPEDKGVSLMPNIGPYDKYSINWGYRPILGKSAKEEKETLDKWILEKAGDPMYRFGAQQGFLGIIDPRAQTEDLGNDAIKASYYGIKNLKVILPQLEKWTREKGKTYSELANAYKALLGQFGRYMGHVIANIGGVYMDNKTTNQKGALFTLVDRDYQKKALKFINKNLFKTPKWLLDKNIFSKIYSGGAPGKIKALQSRTLDNILDPFRMQRIVENKTLNGNKAYSLTNMMSDLRRGIWSEIYNHKSIDNYRRSLQRAYLNRLDYLLNKDQAISKSDIKPIVRAELNRLKTSVKRAIGSAPNNMTRYHLRYAVNLINNILDPKYDRAPKSNKRGMMPMFQK